MDRANAMFPPNFSIPPPTIVNGSVGETFLVVEETVIKKILMEAMKDVEKEGGSKEDSVISLVEELKKNQIKSADLEDFKKQATALMSELKDQKIEMERNAAQVLEHMMTFTEKVEKKLSKVAAESQAINDKMASLEAVVNELKDKKENGEKLKAAKDEEIVDVDSLQDEDDDVQNVCNLEELEGALFGQTFSVKPGAKRTQLESDSDEDFVTAKKGRRAAAGGSKATSGKTAAKRRK